MIEVKNLTKKYGTKLAVDNVSFTAKAGEITGFVGENGAGKSTTLKILMSIVSATSGYALIDSKQYAKYKAPAIKVGSVLDYKVGMPQLSAKAQLGIVAKTYNLPKEKIQKTLELTGLAGAKRKKIGKFSLGMNQRMAIATALITDPEYLVLDEPLNGIDPKGIVWLKDLLIDQAKNQGKTVLLSSHQLSDVAQICDKVAMISGGKLVAFGTVQEIIDKSNISVVKVVTPNTDKLIEGLKEVATTNGYSIDIKQEKFSDNTAKLEQDDDAVQDNDTEQGDDAAQNNNAGQGESPEQKENKTKIKIVKKIDNSLEISGFKIKEIGDIAFKQGVVLHELSMSNNAFESAFMNLTGELK